MLPGADIDEIFLHTEGLWESLRGKRIFHILAVTIEFFLFPFRLIKSELTFSNKKHIGTNQLAVCNFSYTASEFRQKTLSHPPYGQACVF